MQDLYIYYRVREANAAELAPKVRAMQQQLATKLGIVGKLKRRPQAPDGVQTWMEVYLATSTGFEAVLAAAVHDAGLGVLIDGKRHTEVFLDIAPCA